MKINKFVISAAVVGAIALTAAGYAVAQQAMVPKPVEYRQKMMQSLSAHLGGIFSNLKGEVNAKGNIAHHVAALNATAQAIPLVFEPGSEGGKTKPEAWAEKDKLMAAAKALADATAKLAAASGDQIGAAAGEVGRSCGGCHTPYRAQ